MAMPNFTTEQLAVQNSGVLLAAIPLDTPVLNILAQPRQSMLASDSADLAESILTKGQHTPGRVLALKAKAAKEYLEKINTLWNTTRTFSSLKRCKIDGDVYYLFVIYGHRRLRACQDANRLLAEGRTGVFSGTYLCEIFFDLAFEDAVSMQLTENQHVRVSKYEEIEAMWRLWRFFSEQDESLSVAEFARKVGSRSEAIKEMLRFTSLPHSVQQLLRPEKVNGRQVSYGLLVQVGRLHEAQIAQGIVSTEDELLRLVESLLVRRVTVKDFTKEVSERIQVMSNGQVDLFAADGLTKVSRAATRRVAAQEMVHGLWTFMHYWKVIQQLSETGSFGDRSVYAEVSDTTGLYSPHSPARMMQRLVGEMENIAPNLVSLIEAEGKSVRQLKVTEQTLPIIAQLLAKVNEKGGS